MTTLVLKYGGVRFLENEQVVHDVSRAAHNAYNQLVASKRKATQRFREMRGNAVPGLNELEDRDRELRDEKKSLEDFIKNERKKATAKTRRTSPESGTTVRKIRDVAHDETARVEAIKVELKKISPKLKELRTRYSALTEPAREEFKRRKAAFIGDEPSPHKQKAANETVLQEMLLEDWPEAWKQQMVDEAADRESANAMHRDENWYQAATRSQIDEDLNRAAKTSHNMPSFRSLKRVQMGKKVGVQCTPKGVTLGEIAGAFKGGLAILSQRPYRPNSNGNRARSTVATIRMRLQKSGAPTPETVTFDVVMHRPVPEDARIKFAWLVPNTHKGRLSYTLQLVIDTPRPMVQRAPGKGTAHVRIIWEEENDKQFAFAEVNGRRLLTPVSESGRSIRAGKEIGESLQAVIDRLFAVGRDNLKARMGDEDTPGWLAEEARYISNWKRPHKLVEILDRWAKETGDAREVWGKWRNRRLAAGLDLHENLARITPSDVEATGAPSAWYLWMVSYVRKHRHIERWREDHRRKVLAWRKNFYRTTAARLSTEFEQCVLEKVNIASQRRRPAVTAKGSGFEKSRALIQSVAPGEFKEALMGAFGERFSEAEDPGSSRAA